MKKFLDWSNTEDLTDLVLRAGIAHLWFVTIHPFDDGNGRIARAIADTVLARSEQSAQRFYSMSAQIRQERKAYYEILEATEGGLDITSWLEWFLDCLGGAFEHAEDHMNFSDAIVYIVDDDQGARRGLSNFLNANSLIISCNHSGFSRRSFANRESPACPAKL